MSDRQFENLSPIGFRHMFHSLVTLVFSGKDNWVFTQVSC
jgi:hypothetical protein